MHDDRDIRRLFEDVLPLDPERRRAYLDRACPDARVRARVERLLAADASAGPLDAVPSPEALGRAVAARDAEPPVDLSLVGRTISGYRVLRELGRGGMGDVYEAERSDPRRRVALKVLRASALAPGALARFRHEAEVLARLEHPNIARLYDVGTLDTGFGPMPWIAMELVPDGRPITEHAARERLGIEARLHLFTVVCDAVHHGHRKGFIHRDLKPGNILVGADGAARIIDFGVARAVASEVTIATLHTVAGQIVGSLRYMSPEQCAGAADAVDVRSDVYALGVVLYELLTGALPYDIADGTGLFQAPRIIMERPPRPPSAVDRRLGGDVETIILRALRKDPEQRYGSAADLARDVRHHLAGEAIEARREERLYVVRKTIARHRAGVVAAAVLLLVLVGAAAAFAALWSRAEAQRALADERAEALRRESYTSTIALVRAALNEDDAAGTVNLLDRCPADLRNWEWWHLRARADDATAVHETAGLALAAQRNDSATRPASDASRMFAFAVSPVAQIAAIGGDDGQVHLWDLRRKVVLRSLAGLDEPVLSLAFSADGRRVAAREWVQAPPSARADYVVWNVDDGRRVAGVSTHGIRGRIALSPDGSLGACGSDNVVLLQDLASDRSVGQFEPEMLETGGVGFSPDGSRVAVCATNGFSVWDVASRTMLWSTRSDPVGPCAFSPDGARVAIIETSGLVRIHDAADGTLVRTMTRPAAFCLGLAFSPDGRRLAAHSPGAIDVWDVESGVLRQRLHAAARFREGVTFLEGPLRLVTGCEDGRIREFELERSPAVSVMGVEDTFSDAVATSADGRWAATASRRRTIAVWDLRAGRKVATWPAHESQYRMYALAFSPDGSKLASAGEDRMVRVWSLPDGAAVRTLGPAPTPVIDVDWSADGTHLFTADREANVVAWSLAAESRVGAIQPGAFPPPTAGWFESRSPRIVAVAPTGDLVATSGHEGVIRLWRWPGWTPAGELIGHAGLVTALDFSADGRRLASAAHDGTARIWDVASGTCVSVLSGHDDSRVSWVNLSPDGTRVLTCAASAAPVPRLWDADGGTLLLLLPCSGAPFAAFTGDGRSIVVPATDGRVLRIDAPGHPGVRRGDAAATAEVARRD